MKPTYRVLNKTLTIAGCDRQVFISGMMIGVGFFMTFGSIIVGVLVFGFFAFLAWLRAKDPVRIGLLFNGGKYRAHYDAAVREPFRLLHQGGARL